MRNWRLGLVAAVAVLALQACDRSPPVTTVSPPQASLPDDATLRGPEAAPGSQAAAPISTDGTAPQVAATPPAGDGTTPQVAGTMPPAEGTTPPVAGTVPPSDGTSPQASAMGAAPAPAAPAEPAAAPAPAMGQGTAAPTEMWQAFPPAGAASASGSGSSPQKVSAADLPQVRNPGDPQGAQLLAQRALQVPVAGIVPARLSDNYEQSRGKRTHEAMDILAPAGTPVVAVDDGRIAKLFTSKPGGLTIYQFDPQARLAYYYAHLQGYAQGVREGMDVHRGDVIGYVGSTGNADTKTPHLHFAVFRLGSPPKWWQGEAVNPYPALSRAEPAQQVASR